jgi:hypothetical protein
MQRAKLKLRAWTLGRIIRSKGFDAAVAHGLSRGWILEFGDGSAKRYIKLKDPR